LPKFPAPFWLLALILTGLLIVPKLPRPEDTIYVLTCVLVLFPTIIIAGCQCRTSGAWTAIAKFSAELSYPIYILHYPVLQFFDLFHDGGFAPGFTLLLGEVTIISVISLTAARLYETPVRHWLAQRFSEPAKVLA
jgi:peptidoglycan/LPS O-acetylase OafA/YrhL